MRKMQLWLYGVKTPSSENIKEYSKCYALQGRVQTPEKVITSLSESRVLCWVVPYWVQGNRKCITEYSKIVSCLCSF
uniref:Uncharacterized protein n=1 Tax=Setaria italica TaxID=4555 RepID=K3XU33_SETIT